MPDFLGRSVYLTEFEKQKAPLAAHPAGGAPVFISLHIGEEFGPDYPARVRAMETRLVTRERMERMLDARTDDEAAKVLTDHLNLFVDLSDKGKSTEIMVEKDEGEIRLPLRLDLDRRPMQVVDYAHGKEAVTRYRVLARSSGATRVEFAPLTGRTHQLRVHAAHQSGLNAPIKGDMLYGNFSDRLYLHASFLKFNHPVDNKEIILESIPNF